MTTNLQNITTNSPATFNFKSAALNAYSRQIAEIGATMASKNIEIAKILGKIMTEEAYKEDGFQSVQDYAEQTFGIKKSSAYQLANVGRRFYNTEDPTAKHVAAMIPPANLAELKNMTNDEIQAEIDAGNITPETTQKQLREIAAKHKDVKPATVVKTYDGAIKFVIGTSVTIKPFNNWSLDDILDQTARANGFSREAFKSYGPDMKIAVSAAGDVFLVSYSRHVTPKQAHDKAAKNGKVKTFTAEEVEAMIAERIAQVMNDKSGK